ncbi:MAG: DUF1499 domain-containing protein [Tildeniella nuda ZEHNDER 1965/U140]|jgi:uncharacterized protein (DUF1499 family)|nr:DUF1499 domain-containing protein [Tildeniella nuda ZEHNDER 1965/U140]
MNVDRPFWQTSRSVLPIFFASTLLLCWFITATPAVALSLPSTPVVGALFSLAGDRPANLGVAAGKFAPCPTTPNCVSSQSQDAAHAIDPLRYTTAPDVAFDTLKSTLKAQPRVNLLTTTADYIRAEFTIPIVGFVDDVEFYLDREANLIQVRSASRMGESDLGVNRKRIETIRTKLGEE